MDLRREAVRLRDELQATLHVPAKIRWGGLGERWRTADSPVVSAAHDPASFLRNWVKSGRKCVSGARQR